uniref:FGF1 intracellular binding protein n=1 Tax=Sphenodon punctatus TaxID=8508 RepID=A0A8D0GWD3_SPHPU
LAFVREVLGKKLSKGTKKDLDDISAKTGVTLKSCRRQFDNFKRVFKAVEELRGSLVENIQQHFLLSDRLARDYAAVVFFANSRFETGKKKLQFLTFEDFAFCAEQMIQNWTLGAVGASGAGKRLDTNVDDMDVDLDKEFLQDLKELKVLIGDKELLDLHKRLVCTSLGFKTIHGGVVHNHSLLNGQEVLHRWPWGLVWFWEGNGGEGAGCLDSWVGGCWEPGLLGSIQLRLWGQAVSSVGALSLGWDRCLVWAAVCSWDLSPSEGSFCCPSAFV